MCTSVTEQIDVVAHGRGRGEWTPLSSAVVYYDHPARETSEHAMVIDLRGKDGSPSSRVVIEMSVASAAELARTIQRVLSAPPAKDDLARLAVQV
ncbi:MAG: DUF6295 family protein [Acidimicrobiales bacterium]